MMDFWTVGSGSLQHPSSWFILVILLKLSGNSTHSGGSVVKKSAFQTGDAGLILGLGRFPGGGNGNSLQYSCLENPMDREAWCTAAPGVTNSWVRLSEHTHNDDLHWCLYKSLRIPCYHEFIFLSTIFWNANDKWVFYFWIPLHNVKIIIKWLCKQWVFSVHSQWMSLVGCL